MTVRVHSTGAIVTRTALLALMTDVTPDENKRYTFAGAEQYDVSYTLPGSATDDADKAIAFIPGQEYTLADIEAFYPAATVDSITPATGPAAGGTAVVIKGNNFHGVSGVTFGGGAGTSFSVVDDETINVTTPAHAAATVDVVVQDDRADVTVTGGFVYT